jgi:hypothetical protein
MINNPAQYDINVYKDRDFSITFTIKDQSGVLVDIDDWTCSAQIRPTYDSDVLIANFTVTKDNANSQITMTLTDTVTLGIDRENAINANSTSTSVNMVWDLVVDTTGPPAERFTLITGICNFYETVTRAT